MELLKLEHVTKRMKKKTVVDDISMTINSGEIVGFLGPNGAGKTTTIKMIMGLFNITSGDITVCGHNVKTDYQAAMQNVGAIVENPDLYKGLTGRQNLAYFGQFYGKEAVENIESVIELVKMKDRIDDKVKTYSLGMRQRVGLAQSILHMPPLLILDEPTNGLDPIGIKELRELLKNLAHNAGTGVLISSHLLSEMELMCDRVYVIDNGKLIGEKTMQEKEDDTEIYQYTFITDQNEKVHEHFKLLQANTDLMPDGVNLVMAHDQMPHIIAELVHMGVKLYAINRAQRSLEQDFITMTTGSKTQII